MHLKSSIEWLLFLNSWELFNHKSISWSRDVWTDKTWRVLVLKNQRVFIWNHQLSGSYSWTLGSYPTINPFLDHAMSERIKRGLCSSLRIGEYLYEIINWVAAVLELGSEFLIHKSIFDHAMSEWKNVAHTLRKGRTLFAVKGDYLLCAHVFEYSYKTIIRLATILSSLIHISISWSYDVWTNKTSHARFLME